MSIVLSTGHWADDRHFEHLGLHDRYWSVWSHLSVLSKYSLSWYSEIALLLLSVTNCDKLRFLKLKGGITGS